MTDPDRSCDHIARVMSTWQFLARAHRLTLLSPLKPLRIFPPQKCECLDESAEDWSCADPKHQGCNPIHICPINLSQNLSQFMFGGLIHVVTRRAIILELSQNLSQICTQSSKRVLHCTPGRRLLRRRQQRGRLRLRPRRLLRVRGHGGLGRLLSAVHLQKALSSRSVTVAAFCPDNSPSSGRIRTSLVMVLNDLESPEFTGIFVFLYIPC